MNAKLIRSTLLSVLKRSRSVVLLAVVVLLPSIVLAQAAKLSLADLLVGLRSQKVSLEERNRILAEAVKERGITFAPSAVIESELSATGASQ